MNPTHELPLYADFRRSSLAPDGTLAGVKLGTDQGRALLDIDATELDRRVMDLASQSGILPLGLIGPDERQRYVAVRRDQSDDLLRQTADGLRLQPDVGRDRQLDSAQPSGAPFIDEARIVELLKRKLVYQDFVVLGQRLKDGGMDLRLVNGAWMRFLLDSLMSWLETRFADPALTEIQRKQLLDAFAPALVVVDEMLSAGSDQRQAILAARTNLQVQIQHAQERAADAETELAVRHGLPVTRQALLDAARRHAGGAAAAASPTATRDGHAQTLGRIID